MGLYGVYKGEKWALLIYMSFLFIMFIGQISASVVFSNYISSVDQLTSEMADSSTLQGKTSIAVNDFILSSFHV